MLTQKLVSKRSLNTNICGVDSQKIRGTRTTRLVLIAVSCALCPRLDAKLLSSRGSHWKQPLNSYGVEIGYNMGRTRERAWRNNDTPKKKLKQTQNARDRLLDEDDDDDVDDDVELLEPKLEECELDENASLTSDPLEKFLSCQDGMVCVQGYTVKLSIAKILDTIFKKHGDIAANCIFKTSSTRTHFLEVVCDVVRRIKTNDLIEMVEDIECQLLDVEAANINVSWIRAHFEGFDRRKEISKEYSLLMEMKANAVLVKRAAQMDLKERFAELVVAQDRFKKAERSVRVLHLVAKNLHDSILEAKVKLDSWVKHPVI